MFLYYYAGFDKVSNFGDELNPYIWEKFLPGIMNNDEDELFVGIGTLLNDRIPEAKKVIVMGSGVGYGKLPDRSVIDKWDIYCLRGKLSIAKLGVSDKLLATDPAILVHQLFKEELPKKYRFAYMPHWMNMGSGWQAVCDSLNFKLLDPLDSVENIIKGIKESEVVITEAMHGAIVSDALRVPWIAVHSDFGDNLPFKWQDWCSSLDLDFSSTNIGRLWHPEDIASASVPKRLIKSSGAPVMQLIVEKRLSAIARKNEPVLSDFGKFNVAVARVEDAIVRFGQKYN